MSGPASAPSQSRPVTPEAVRAAYEAVRLPGAEAPLADWENSFWAWNDIKLWLAGEGSRRFFKEAQDGRNEQAAAEFRYLREAILPVQEQHDARLREAFLKCPRRAELEAVLGSQLFKRMELDQAAFVPVNIALSTREGEVVSLVERLYGNTELDVGGRKVTLARANALLSDASEAVRRAAWLAMTQFAEAHRATLHGHYDELVSLRHKMARNLGEETFIPVGYRKMGRTDYGPADVAVFRDSIRTHVRPLLARLREAQAGWLGQPTVKPWDMSCFPGFTLGTDVVPVANQLAQAGRLFHRLHPKLGAHFDYMVANDLIDLEARPGKRPGAFAIAFEDTNQIAIFCNSSGAETDVTTLTHEMGHAFQAWESLWIRPLETRLATMDAAELTSMGMEYLALEEITAFFTPDQARRFARVKIFNALQRLAYVCVVDEFQHWVYAHPGHSHAEREEAWERSWEAYVPGLDFSVDPLGRRLRWLRQAHIFGSPFYYIDYALADVGALQLWSIARKDHARAMESYLELCRLGGTRSLVGIFAAAGLRSPFEPDVLAPIVAELASKLEL